MNKKNQLFSTSSIILLFCIYIYMMFWENRFVNSRAIYLLVAVFSMITLFLSSDLNLGRQAIAFIILVIYNIVQLSLMNNYTNDSVKWIETLIIYAIVLLALTDSFQKGRIGSSLVMVPLTILSGVFVFGIYLQKLFPEITDRINNIFLSSESIRSNHTFYKWGYFCGFSGLTFVPGLDCMVFGLLQLDRAMSKELNKVKRILCFACVLLAIYGTILVQKRGLFVATLVCIGIYTLLRAENKKSLFASIALIVIIGVFSYYILNSNESGALFLWRAFEKEDLTSGRAGMWSDLIKKSYDALLTGYGPASVTAIYSGDAHNIYIQVLYENGIIGLGLYLAFFGINLRTSYVCYKSGNSLARIGVAIQIAILVYGFTGNPLTDIFIFLLYLLASTMGYLQTASTVPQEKIKTTESKYIKT